MNIYDTPEIGSRLHGNPYVGRGIVIGCTADGRRAAVAYFIMGRSRNSRNRIFREKDGVLYTEPQNPQLVEDPSLIIYAAMRRTGNHLIVTNGDQTDTIFAAIQAGGSFASALETRSFEPDAPNFTPRISGILTFCDGGFSYKMSILKSADAAGSACNRFTYAYAALPGVGHFLHTYVTDGNPLPTFQGEPERISVPDDIEELTASIWENLDAENRISLCVRMIDIATGKEETRLINQYAGE